MSTTYRIPGAVLTEREHTVPLNHLAPDGRTITVFTREIADPDGLDKPYLIFFQGGPGFEAPRPTTPPSGWVKRALKDFRVLMLDQRGVGRSTPLGRTIPGATAEKQAEYLTHFRADSIVRDAELIRQELGVDRWSTLGQSFGGFCTMTYLSIAPQSLRESFITGGLSAIGRPVDDIYSTTYQLIARKNREYFRRYPEDQQRIKDICAHLDDEDVQLPGGDRLTSRRFRQIGGWLGFISTWESIHHVVELPCGSNAFLWDAERGASAYERNPIYATIHEACYADGGATRWSAARLYPAEFDQERYLTAEHIFPWMFEDYGALQEHRAAADILANHEWPRLYDPDVLAHNEVPVAAAIYYNDPYVPSQFSIETAEQIRGLRPWITNEFEHDALRMDPERLLGRLIDMTRGRA
jgi:pimeloyl-ACP methyl ester carboxylesterase